MSLEYEFFCKNKVLFEKGDIGRKMYLILKGEIAILIPVTREVYDPSL